MNEIVKLFNDVRQIPGAAAKAEYLKAHHNPLVDQIITDAMDPSITYGVTSKELSERKYLRDDLAPTDLHYDRFHALLLKLANRELTGNAASNAIDLELSCHGEAEHNLLVAVLDRDLKLGVSWSTYRSQVMGITEKFEVALAQHLEKVRGVDPVDGTYFASRKCDGCRDATIIDCGAGIVEFRSRQNKQFTTLDNLKAAVLRFCAPLSGKWVLDGELCKVDENGDEDFQSIMKEIRRKDFSIEDCCYKVFDILTYDEFCEGKSKDILSKRFELIDRLNSEYVKQPHERCWIQPLKQERLLSQDDFDRWAGYVEKGNWEGFMLRKDTYYQSGRTKDLLKVKKFFDQEFEVVGVETGEMTTAVPGQGLIKYEGVTALHITHKGNDVRVGAGLSREQRVAWMKDPSLIIGKTITVKYFETTTNKEGKESLRFPTLKFVYENGRDC